MIVRELKPWNRALLVVVLFSIWPVLTLAAENIGEVYFREVAVWSAGFSIAGLTLWALLWLLLKDPDEASVLVACASLLLFVAPQLFVLAGGAWPLFVFRDIGPPGPFPGLPVAVFSLFVALVVAFGVAILRDTGLAPKAARLIRVLGLALVAVPTIHISLPLVRGEAVWSYSHQKDGTAAAAGAMDQRSVHNVWDKPDVYYIVLDRYGSEPVLKRFFGFENRVFLDELRSRGFYVADRSVANYLKSAHSLASTLNLDYLSTGSLGVDKGSRSYLPLFDRIANNLLQQTLRDHGYKYYHFGSWWRGTERARAADYDFMANHAGDSFSAALLEGSLLGPIPPFIYGRRDRHRARVLAKLDELPAVSQDPAPTFTFAHFLIPHDPFVLDADGNPVSQGEEQARSWRDNYVQQVRFLNDRLLQLVDTVLENSEVSPIMIIQADEGPYLRHHGSKIGYADWLGAPPDSLLHKFGILNALRIPRTDSSMLWPTMTPVNTFRIVLNVYFEAGYEILPDRSYVFPVEQRETGSKARLYDFSDVTDNLREALDVPEDSLPYR